jgi:hypothetical protein
LREQLVKLIRIIGAAAIAVIAVVAPAAGAGAHTGDQSYVYVDVLSDRIEGRVEYLVRDLNEVLGLDIADDAATAPDQLEAARTQITAFTDEHFSIDLGSGPEALTYEELEYLELSQGSYVVLHYATRELDSAPPRTFSVSYDAFFDERDDISALLLIGRDWQSGVLSNEANSLDIFDDDTRTVDVALDEGSWWKGMRESVDLGVEHIRTGADHVMFIVALLLPSVLVFRQVGWRPAAGFTATLWRVLKVATAFTLAHSITLSLAALEIVTVDAKLIESVIALSIAAAALHNLRPVFANREWLIALGFGLFHGLGLAGLLQELGLARDQRLATLLGFNLGVEIGQVAIILCAFPTLYVLRRVRWYRPAMVIASIGLAAASIGWAVERVFELQPRVDEIFDPILVYPRVLLLAAIAFGIAVAIQQFERSRGRLLPVDGDADSDPAEAPALVS